MRDIVFYNHYHNGDVFSGKGWIQDIMRQVPDINYGYAHSNNPKIVEDLECVQLDCNELPFGVVACHRYPYSEDVIYINTWIGSYINEILKPNEKHGNWSNLHHMWSLIYDKLNEINDMNLTMDPDPLKYIPSTNWAPYRTDLVDNFISEHAGARGIRLFCNGTVRSLQSNFNGMAETIQKLAGKYTEDIFVCTAKNFTTDLPNIVFTEDVFGLENDINEIAYLSTHEMCYSIIGQNSGPYIYCHVRENIFNSDKQFISLSQRPSDSYPWGTTGIECYYVHCLSENTERVTEIIDGVIDDWYESPGYMKVVA